MRRFLDMEDDDPLLSVVNVIDVFLVMIVLLLIVVAQREAAYHAASEGGVVSERSEALERFVSSGTLGEGQGVRAGTTYRLPDGSLVLVPDDD
ncbi:DUF2149 domain-containing protein [Billgrantia pellis]|uniref:DUF2149 domain-containing protein n=1 Tax=Billgrantia pellis TaxID=2606936 RepID=A0A7V7FZ19_9GAMM|nr:DUF2149 domain-containing protein [Halomonas pellis]KAA0011898.1 DUF2149 domain-containing protein [Halomonas pellis]